VSVAGCSSSSLASLKNTVANPFSKKEVPLPGERIAVITDPTAVGVDPAEAARPSGIAVTPSAANASAITRAMREASVARLTKAMRLGPEPETATAP